jgi:acetyl/propionyl-CoA carboxylase alpha subunit
MRSIGTILIANRGEIAVRIARTCRRLGIRTVAVVSDADADAMHVRAGDVAVRLPGSAAADTYLRADLLIGAAQLAGADAIHPGYGFLAESADFARAVADAGLIWIGPPADSIAVMGSKIEAKARMRAAGVPVLLDSTVVADLDELGYPLLVKASAGGGGRGMRIVEQPGELATALTGAEQEAAAAFGDGTLFIERYVRRGRHVEIQVMADAHGAVVALHERECSVQRRHQKIIEESPSPAVDADLRRRMGAAAIDAARAVGYIGAGTVEFLLEPDGRFSFLEMNTRLQVEHPVTEAVTGLDLVELQIAVAEGAPLPPAALDAPLAGHAIEARLTAEDPAAGYRPSTGTFRRFAIDGDVRVDTGVESGSTVSPHYDSMVAKVIAHGPTRPAAIRKLAAALRQARLHGPSTNRDQLLNILGHPAFNAGDLHTGFLDEHPCTDGAAKDVTLHAVVASLALQASHRAQAAVLAAIPSGWRNNPAVDRTVDLAHGDASVRVSYRLGRDPWVRVDGEPVLVDVLDATPEHVVVELAGTRLAFDVAISGDIVDVDGPDAHVAFTVIPRFPDPDVAATSGSLLAPMPGTVRRVLVGRDDRVAAGQPLVIVEAMKMEHQIAAPAAGRVDDVLVGPGDQVETGQRLLHVELEDQ